ncbi:hypothetical protein J2Z53_000748 [Clostridium moniliforme]|uniref:EpsG family protein n=1 Tax=Clostridium moniliforme TaxID=39489 RepID=A0ABS4EYU4_9CLOT|nr:EpsG family protein [Clostridium moniliforme]MBP1889167.1 hypothetical protein [Clostridium moniliforme]
MIFLAILIVIGYIAFFSTIYKKNNKIIYFIFASIFIILSMFRYGIGTDYIAYLNYYKNNSVGVINSIRFDNHMDIGYRILMGISKKLGISFEGFIMIISFIMIALVSYIIINNSKNRILSLFVFYSVYYQIYINSAIRQGIALSIFIYAFYKYLKNGNNKKYIISIIFAALFHKSILITLIIVLINRKIEFLFQKTKLNIFFLFIAIAIFLFKGERLFVTLFNIGYKTQEVNILAILLRVIILMFIIYLYINSEENSVGNFEKLQIYLIYIGLIIYFIFCRINIMSRLTEYFSIIEVILIPNLLTYLKGINLSKRIICVAFYIVICSSIYIKDTKSFLEQGSYFSKNILDYKYISIFNKDEIYLYRNMNINMDI